MTLSQPYRHVAAGTDVDAVWVTTANLPEAAAWCGGRVDEGAVVHPAWDGLYQADPGEWLVREADGEYSVVPAELFQTEYRVGG